MLIDLYTSAARRIILDIQSEEWKGDDDYRDRLLNMATLVSRRMNFIGREFFNGLHNEMMDAIYWSGLI